MKRLFLILLTASFLFTGCSILQISPSVDSAQYEMLGRDIGSYLNVKKPEFVAQSVPWVEGALTLTDEQLINGNVLQAAYEYALKANPEDAEFILLIKSSINILGIKIDASQLLPEEKPKYVECVRGVLKGYAAAIK